VATINNKIFTDEQCKSSSGFYSIQSWSPQGRGLGLSLEAPRGWPVVSLLLKIKSLALASKAKSLAFKAKSLA